MRNNAKRIVSLVMALCMVLTMLPATVFAVENEPAAAGLAPSGDVLTSDNVRLDSRFFTPTKGGYKTVYTGKHINATPIVEDVYGNQLMEGYDYTVRYSHATRRNVGKYTITVTGMGRYSGTVELAMVITPKAPDVSVRLSTASGGYDDAYVTWNKVSGASGYYVYYRRPSRSSSWSSLTRTTHTSVLKKDLYDGYKYEFKVVPYVLRDGTRYLSSDYDTAYTYTLKKMSSPSLSRYSSTRVRVSWANISGESGYQVSRSTSSSGTYIVYTTSGTAVNLTTTGEKTYYYKVRAYKNVTKDGKTYRVYGPWSSTRSFALKALEAPEMRNYNYAGSDYIKLTWSRNTHASGYYVYRKSNGSDSWDRIAKISGNSHVTYTDKTARSGYDYCVRAYGYKNGDLIYSNRSNAVHCHTLRPARLDIQNNDEFKNVLHWNSVSYATGYDVYRKVGPDASWERIARLGKVNDYTDLDTGISARHYYKVRPVYRYNGNITYGPYSNVEDYLLYIGPDIEAFAPESSQFNVGLFRIYLQNNGDTPVRIYAEDAVYLMPDSYQGEYDRNLILLAHNPDDPGDESQHYRISYQDIQPGEAASVVFRVDGPGTYYSTEGTFNFYFTYEDVRFIGTAGNADGFRYTVVS